MNFSQISVRFKAVSDSLCVFVLQQQQQEAGGGVLVFMVRFLLAVIALATAGVATVIGKFCFNNQRKQRGKFNTDSAVRKCFLVKYR